MTELQTRKESFRLGATLVVSVVLMSLTLGTLLLTSLTGFDLVPDELLGVKLGTRPQAVIIMICWAVIIAPVILWLERRCSA